MHYDSLTIGSCPTSEPCVQVGRDNNYGRAQREECRAFIEALRRLYGEEPEGARLRVASHPHDFGTYYEVECKFDPDVKLAVEYAFKLEAESPETWDEVGMICPWVRVNGTYSIAGESTNSPKPETWGRWKNGQVVA